MLTRQSCAHLLIIQAMAIINGSLYVFGGTTGYIYSTDLHKLDLNTREWTQLKPNNLSCDLPEERWDSRIEAYSFLLRFYFFLEYWQYGLKKPFALVEIADWLLDPCSALKKGFLVRKWCFPLNYSIFFTLFPFMLQFSCIKKVVALKKKKTQW